MNLFMRWMFVLSIFVVPASAAIINVAPGEVAVNAGNGLCSLREALANAESGADSSGGDCATGTGGADTIVLAAASTYTVPDTFVVHPNYGNTGLPEINSTITITGNNAIIQRDPTLFAGTPCGGGGAKFRILYVGPTGNLTLSFMTLRNGCAFFGATGAGGALFNRGTLSADLVTITNNAASASAGAIQNDGTLTLMRSTLSNNATTIGAGGGIVNTATMQLLQSTINDNATVGAGGGIDNTATATAATVANSTLSANLSSGLGGGLHNRGSATFTNVTVALNRGTQFAGTPGPGSGLTGRSGSVTLSNSLIVSNGTNCGPVGGSFSGATNIDTDGTCAGASFTATPLIGPLANNGGTFTPPTFTHALLTGSPAIDTGNAATCSAPPVNNVDQRGMVRPRFGSSSLTCDVGAFEAAGPADLAVALTLTTSGPYFVGQSISYNLDVTNAGPDTATTIQVTDTPTNLTITNVSGACTSFSPCTIASLTAGANTTITVTATINALGAFDNSATAMATESDPNPANNTDSTGNGGTAAPSADVSITKTLDTAGPYFAGNSVTYTITVANAGPSTATNVNVTDTPANLTITNVSGACTSFSPCLIASILSGANTTITVTATIVAAGAFDNSASASGAEFDPNSANNTDNTGNGGTAATSADVSITKTLDTAGPYFAGQSVTYTITVANAGPSTATNVQVTDTPTNLTITNVSGGGCASLPCTIASIASGANTTITVAATIVAAGAFDNSATATAAEPDSNLANNTDNTGNGGTAAASADVSIVKTLTTAGPYTIGQSVSYSLLVANAGPSTATNVQVTDTPTNLTITNVSGSGCASLPCTIASIASGSNTTITVTATTVAAGAFDNSASASGAEFDPNSANNTDNTGNGGTAGTAADVSIMKTLMTAGPYFAGQSVTYTITVANAGPSTATNVQVTDTPTNLTITNVSGSGCASLPCTIASIASGANTTITVTATIAAAGAFDNTASASGVEFDPNSANNTDNSGNGGTAAAAAFIPALGWMGMVMLAMTLALAGAVVMRSV